MIRISIREYIISEIHAMKFSQGLVEFNRTGLFFLSLSKTKRIFEELSMRFWLSLTVFFIQTFHSNVTVCRC